MNINKMFAFIKSHCATLAQTDSKASFWNNLLSFVQCSASAVFQKVGFQNQKLDADSEFKFYPDWFTEKE